MMLRIDNVIDGLRPILALLLCLTSTLALAHKVNMFAYVEGDQVFLEGYFSDGKKAMNSEVKVFDDQGKLVWQGKTNEAGEASFKLPETGHDLRITINAGMGHRAEYRLSASEIGGGEADVATDGPAESEAASTASGGSTTAVAGGIDPKQLRHIVRREVGEAIKPLVRGLSELKERRGISDIVGGIGIIAGLLGAWFFVQARRLQQQAGDERA